MKRSLLLLLLLVPRADASAPLAPRVIELLLIVMQASIASAPVSPTYHSLNAGQVPYSVHADGSTIGQRQQEIVERLRERERRRRLLLI